MTSEADFEHRLYSDLSQILEDKKHLIGGLKLTLSSQYQVDRKRADLVIFASANKPILVIETKRKSGQRPSTSEKTFPYAYAVIGQALCYAYLLALEFKMPSTPSFATANPDHIVVFKPIELSNISSFID
ncbi:MAG: hypothetical protein JZD41_09225, partial [Thermoproteus sp.]|nr:hypothetical protein [Thermoproteus sp.]